MFGVNTLFTIVSVTDINKLLLLQVPSNGVENTVSAATATESFLLFNNYSYFLKFTLIKFHAHTLIYELQYCYILLLS